MKKDLESLALGLLAVSNALLFGLFAYLVSSLPIAFVVAAGVLTAWGGIFLYLSRVRPSEGNVSEYYGQDARVSQTRRNYSGAQAEKILEDFKKGKLV